jgi:hypothetical protein
MKRPNELSIRKTAATVGRLNISLPPFPEGDETQEGFNQRSYQGKRPDSQEEPRSQAQKRNTQEWRYRKTLKPHSLYGRLSNVEKPYE